MRNKKLISMLMLSAGFVACTQDEIVENNYADIENQKDLVEDVVLNVSLEEGLITRAAYAGGATEVDEDGKRTAYEVYQNFYLEPAWTDENKSAYSVSDQEALVGDQIGFCYNLNGAAITNYPFYIAGYGSANKVTTSNGQTTITKKVYGLAAQSGLYDLSIPAGEFAITNAANIKASIGAVGKILVDEERKWGDLEPLELDVRKGIVRTNAGIMTGKYIAYFPYNGKFVDPQGIPAQGKEALKDIYTAELAGTREEALQNVNFYDYLFANAREEVTVSGGTKAGDVKIVPQTSALTFAFTNSTEKDVKGVKRITLKAATAGDKPFILTGSVSLDALNSVKAKTTTDLIGAQFQPTTIPAATFDAEGKVASQSYQYVTIPYMADETDGTYIIEIYNNNGEIAVINNYKPSGEGLGLGRARVVTIDLKDKKFEKGTRKIFTVEDFQEEAPAGGTLELMKDLNLANSVSMQTLGTSENPVDLTIIGGKALHLKDGDYYANIKMEKGELGIYENATVNGNIECEQVRIDETSKVNGNINATDGIIIASPENFVQNAEYALTAPTVNVTDGTYNNITADDVIVDGATLERTTKTVGNATVTATCVTAKVNLQASTGTIKWAVAENVAITNKITVTGNLEANKIDLNEYSTDGRNWYDATLIVTGSVKSGATLIIDEIGSTVDWNTVKAMDLNVTNKGTLNVGESTEVISGTIINNGTLNLEGDIAGNGNGLIDQVSGALNVKDNFTLVAFTVNVKGGKVEIASEAKMSGRSASLVVEGGEVIKVTNNADFKTDLDKTTTTFAQKYTALKVNSTITASNANTAAVDKVYMETGASLSGSYTLPAVIVNGKDAKLETTGENTANKAASITINKNAKLTVTGKLEVDGNVVNNGTYDGTDAVVNCEDFSGNGTWTNNVTPNC